MSSSEDFTAKKAEIESISEDRIKSPNMPVDVFVQESENLHKWADEDRAELEAAGLPGSMIDDLLPRAGALRHLESEWFKTRFSREEAQREWNEKSKLAYDLRDRLLHDLRYAFRNDPDLLGRVSDIADGSGHADMIQDLNDLAALGRANAEKLAAINLDTAGLDEAAATADSISELLASATVGREDNSEARILRDKAYTYLKEAVDEVRACGQYVFWRDESRLKGYSSAYFRRMRSRNKGKTGTDEAESADY